MKSTLAVLPSRLSVCSRSAAPRSSGRGRASTAADGGGICDPSLLDNDAACCAWSGTLLAINSNAAQSAMTCNFRENELITVSLLELNPSNIARVQSVQCGFFLMKKPLEKSGFGYIYSDSAVGGGRRQRQSSRALARPSFITASKPEFFLTKISLNWRSWR